MFNQFNVENKWFTFIDKIKRTARIVISSGGGRQFLKEATFGGKGTTLMILRII